MKKSCKKRELRKWKRAVIITGTPGTGKTMLAKELASRSGLEYVDVNDVIGKHGLSEGYDRTRRTEEIDPDRLSRVLIGMIEDSEKKLLIDSHMSHFLPKEYVKLCIVTKCSLPELKTRLAERGYSGRKMRENMDAEIFDVCLTDAYEAGHNVLVVETDKKIDYAMLLGKI